jgi:hypothetical protein
MSASEPICKLPKSDNGTVSEDFLNGCWVSVNQGGTG